MSIFGMGHEVVTSTTKPSSPVVGQLIYCTDTDEYLKYVNYGGANRWMQAVLKPNRNVLINGGFDVWQRSTDVTASTVSPSYYAAADRWQTWLGSATNIRYRRTTGTNNTYAYRIQRQSGSAVATNTQITQGMEQANATKLAGKTVTLSFFAKRGTNFSAASNALSARIYSDATPDLNLIGMGATTLVATTSPSLTTTMTHYTLTATIPSNAVYVGVNFIVNWTGTAGADDWFELENAQLEIGTAPSEFEFEPFETTLRKCMRYYEVPTWSFRQTATATGYIGGHFACRVRKRVNVAPTNFTFGSVWSGSGISFNSFQVSTEDGCGVQLAGTGNTEYYGYGNTCIFNAEL